jgi:hypothetical protein
VSEACYPLLDDRSCSEFEDELDALFLVGLLGGEEEDVAMLVEDKPQQKSKRAKIVAEDEEERRAQVKARNRASAERTR